MKKLVGIKCREKFLSQISSNCSFDQESVFSFQHCVIVLQPTGQSFTRMSSVRSCLPTVGYLLAVKSWLFIFLSEKKLKGQYALRESPSISQSDKDKYPVCMSILHICPQKSLCLKQLYQNDMKVILQAQMRTSQTGKISVQGHFPGRALRLMV